MSTVKEVRSSQIPKSPAREMTEEQMRRDYQYKIAQKFTKELHANGLINDDEFKKISALNRTSFRPYLFELMG